MTLSLKALITTVIIGLGFAEPALYITVSGADITSDAKAEAQFECRAHGGISEILTNYRLTFDTETTVICKDGTVIPLLSQ